jgi:hypothetical protein
LAFSAVNRMLKQQRQTYLDRIRKTMQKTVEDLWSLNVAALKKGLSTTQPLAFHSKRKGMLFFGDFFISIIKNESI